MDAKAPAAVTAFRRGPSASDHLKGMAVTPFAKTDQKPAAASHRLKRLGAG